MSSPLSTPLGHTPAANPTVADLYDLLILDLDGTVRAGRELLPNAADTLSTVNTQRAFVTNNAMHTPVEVAEMLTAAGLATSPDQVFTSTQATISQLDPQQVHRVYVVGTPALAEMVESSGFTVVTEPAAGERVDAVVHGLSMETTWTQLTAAATHVRSGARYVATNLDTTIPTENGLGLGNGSMVAAVTAGTGVVAESFGKPNPAVIHLAAQHFHARTPLTIGDRLDTDIAAGVAAGTDTMVVLTGVTAPLELLAAPNGQRPRLIAEDLSGVTRPLSEVRVAMQGQFVATVKGKDLIISGGTAESTPLDALRSACAAAWAPGATTPTNVIPASDYAEKAVNAWW